MRDDRMNVVFFCMRIELSGGLTLLPAGFSFLWFAEDEESEREFLVSCFTS